MTFLLLTCLLAATLSGMWAGRKLAVAQHQGAQRKITDAALLHGGVTLLTLLYGLVLQPGNALWPVLMLLGSGLGLAAGLYLTQRHPPHDLSRELSSAQLRTEAILER